MKDTLINIFLFVFILVANLLVLKLGLSFLFPTTTSDSKPDTKDIRAAIFESEQWQTTRNKNIATAVYCFSLPEDLEDLEYEANIKASDIGKLEPDKLYAVILSITNVGDSSLDGLGIRFNFDDQSASLEGLSYDLFDSGASETELIVSNANILSDMPTGMSVDINRCIVLLPNTPMLFDKEAEPNEESFVTLTLAHDGYDGMTSGEDYLLGELSSTCSAVFYFVVTPNEPPTTEHLTILDRLRKSDDFI